MCTLLSLLSKDSGEHFPAATNTWHNRRNVGRVIFYAVRVLANETLWIGVPLSLQGNNEAKTFPRQRWIVGGVIFYPIRDVWKESRRLVFPLNFFLILPTRLY
jgi:hypothetical protein